MESEIIKKVRNPFPALYICVEDNAHFVVLMTEYGKGTVIRQANSCYTVGYHTGDWEMSFFELYSGSVTISNY